MAALLEDYSGPFEADFHLGRLARPALARLARETMLFAHFHDRGLMPLLGRRFGPAAMTEVACDEWMGSSPIYNRRNRALLGIAGDGVSAILKAFQLDIGFPHQYMDVRYEVVDETRGYFWLPFCGAYQDVHRISRGAEPAIVQLCHHMEDPTFDATVMAVNPRARARPVHRPPLPSGHEGPTCRWEVFVGDDAGAVDTLPITEQVASSRAAGFRFSDLPADLGPGMPDYAGPLRSPFALEELAQPVLARQCAEFALDAHLLMRAAFGAVRERYGDEAATELAAEQWAALAPVVIPRLRAALGIEGDDAASILKTLQVDPALPHEYVRPVCELLDERRGRFRIEACAAFEDDEPEAWTALLAGERAVAALDAVVAAVNPHARCRRLPDALHAFEVTIDPAAPPRPESPMAAAVRASNVAGFRFRSD